MWNLRAVAVSGELVSDPLSASYKVFMPSPQIPGYSLAPGTYEKRQRIWLRPGKENEKVYNVEIIRFVNDVKDENWDASSFMSAVKVLIHQMIVDHSRSNACVIVHTDSDMICNR